MGRLRLSGEVNAGDPSDEAQALIVKSRADRSNSVRAKDERIASLERALEQLKREFQIGSSPDHDGDLPIGRPRLWLKAEGSPDAVAYYTEKGASVPSQDVRGGADAS